MPGILRRTTVTVAVLAVIGLAAVALLEAGVAIGSAADRQPAAASTTGGAGSADDSALASDLDVLLAADQAGATDPAAASPNPTTKVRINAAVNGLRRLAAARRLVHGTVVVDLPKLGGLTTIQLDHGSISAVSPSSLSVAETGGTTVTVTLGDETHVRRNATKAAIADLKTGDEVFVMSKVESGETVAYLVVVPAI